jgi:hypothetical protein
MKQLMLGLAVVPALLAGSIVLAQDLDKLQKPGTQLVPDDQVTQTEDMWFYLQELRRYDDPQMAIRRRAETKGRQRRERLAAMKWFGYSQSRPVANPTPSMGYYSPMWAGNGCDPFLWIGNAYVTTTVRVRTAAATESKKIR